MTPARAFAAIHSHRPILVGASIGLMEPSETFGLILKSSRWSNRLQRYRDEPSRDLRLSRLEQYEWLGLQQDRRRRRLLRCPDDRREEQLLH